MDAFYASIEQRDHPELRGKPVIVGANSERGVVAAASYEARVFGVRSAMPGFRARQLCPDGIYLPADMEKYAAVSEQIHGVFAEFTPEVEPLALDEAFLDVSGSVRLFEGPLTLARALKRRVREETGLAVSVGVAPNKLVAKIACSLSKPDGLLVVPESAIRWLMDPLPVRRLWSVGPVLEEKLVSRGICTVRDLRCRSEAELVSIVGARARDLHALARGDDTRPVMSGREPVSFGEESTFEQDVTERLCIVEALTAHAETVTGRLRRDGWVARTVTLKVKLGRARRTRASRIGGAAGEPVYPLLTRSRTLPDPTSDPRRVRAVAVELWDAAGITEPVRLLGVTLTGLLRRPAEQLELFAPRPGPSAVTPAARGTERLGATLDAIEARFGRGSVRLAVADPGKITHSSQRKRGR
jgi:DNA polymerase-4